MQTPPEPPQPAGESVEDFLARKFPSMEQGKKAPSLSTINGVGTRFTGCRDHDAETQSYVTTLVFSVLYIPLFAISAWRVISAGGGHYRILGREPLSRLAKRLNWALVAAVAIFAGTVTWHTHVNSPGYLADRAMERAGAALAEGKPAAAMQETLLLLDRGWPRQDDARELYRKAFDAALRTGTVDERKSAVAAARTATVGPHGLVKDEAAKILAWATSEPDAKIAAEVMQAGLPAVPESERSAYEDHRRTLLEKVIAADPGNSRTAVDLAFIYDEKDRAEDCRKLLLPHRESLGDGEGARILGRILVSEGDYRGGASLLQAYSAPRLPQYHEADKKLQSVYKSASDAAVSKLNQNRGPAEFYRKYEKAGTDEQDRLVQDFIAAEVKKSVAFVTAQERLAETSRVVPVMLDLGIAGLNLARDEPDAAKRQAGLAAAEKAFLSIEGSAGETKEYQLFLGQVYYWMGKHSEGKTLFDKLLAQDSSTEVALMVSESLRQVGEREEARRIAEAAWKKGQDAAQRSSAAKARAVLWKDTDDRILWLERCEVRSQELEIDLQEARAQKLIDDGKRNEAIPLLRSAAASYDKLPRSAGTLNNSANMLSTLYGITHDPQDFRESLNRYEEALKLQPDNTVLLSNLAVGHLGNMWLEAAARTADLKTLPSGIQYLLASQQHRNEAEEIKFSAGLRASDSAKRAQQLLGKLLVMAPRDSGHCSSLQSYWDSLRDAGELRRLLAHATAAKFDHAEAWEAARKGWAENQDKQALASIAQNAAQADASLAALPKDTSPQVRAALQAYRLGLQLAASGIDGSGKPADFTASAVALIKLHDGYGSMSTALDAFLRAAVLECDADPDFAAFNKKHGPHLSDTRLLGLALHTGTGAAAIKASPALRRWLENIRDLVKRWPEHRGPGSWVLLSHLSPPDAEACREAILKCERLTLDVELNQVLSPAYIGTAFESWALCLMKGDTVAAAEIWKTATAAGMPLPEL